MKNWKEYLEEKYPEEYKEKRFELLHSYEFIRNFEKLSEEIIEYIYEYANDLGTFLEIVEQESFSIWRNTYELGYETVQAHGIIERNYEQWFNFESFGDAILEDGHCYLLNDGKVLEIYW